jgi:hypothetical protein
MTGFQVVPSLQIFALGAQSAPGSPSTAGQLGLGVLFAACGIGLMIYGDRLYGPLYRLLLDPRRRRTTVASVSVFVSRRVVPTIFIIVGALEIVLGLSHAF